MRAERIRDWGLGIRDWTRSVEIRDWKLDVGGLEFEVKESVAKIIHGSQAIALLMEMNHRRAVRYCERPKVMPTTAAPKSPSPTRRARRTMPTPAKER